MLFTIDLFRRKWDSNSLLRNERRQGDKGSRIMPGQKSQHDRGYHLYPVLLPHCCQHCTPFHEAWRSLYPELYEGSARKYFLHRGDEETAPMKNITIAKTILTRTEIEFATGNFTTKLKNG